MQLVAWLSSFLAAVDRVGKTPVAPRPEQTPVVLVHGIFSSSRDMARLAQHLRREGREVFTPDLLPAGGHVGIDELAQQLAEFVRENLGGRRFDLVGFSMGGLVSRYSSSGSGGWSRSIIS